MKLIAKSLAVAAAVVASGAAFAQVSYDANLELNNVFRNRPLFKEASATNADSGSSFDSTGRIEFNLNGKATKGEYFAAGRATLLIKTDGTTGVDDMWGQVGNKDMNVKLGRFEAMDLFPTGKDVAFERVTDISFYQANSLRGREFGSASKNNLHLALGYTGVPGLTAELGAVAGKNDGTGKTTGVRPAVTYTAGPLTVRGGAEYVKTDATSTTSSSSKTGFGLSGSYDVMPGTTASLNFAKMKSKKTIGANVVAGNFGLGLIHGSGSDTGTDIKETVVYTAYTVPLLDIKGASVTPALSFARATSEGTSRSVVGANLRLNYAF